jgi:hypothetical protein
MPKHLSNKIQKSNKSLFFISLQILWTSTTTQYFSTTNKIMRILQINNSFFLKFKVYLSGYFLIKIKNLLLHFNVQ